MTTWSEYKGSVSGFRFEQKAPQDLILDIPQEKFTGDILRGHGPRRGNLERLLRYWRPIMRKSGGFTRCKVILADHPELYPLSNICAWLHHETTGLWPNEGCHHPDMKNCRKKMKRIANGSIWSDSEFSRRVSRGIRVNSRKKSDNLDIEYKRDNYDDVVTAEDEEYATQVMTEFADMEKKFCKVISHDDNWEQEGDPVDKIFKNESTNS